LLRQDNAIDRLLEHARGLGTLGAEDLRRAEDRIAERGRATTRIRSVRVSRAGADTQGSLAQLLCSGGISLEGLLERAELADLDRETVESAAIEVRYEGYIRRQLREVERTARYECLVLHESIWDEPLLELSREGREKLGAIRPTTVAQAARIAGISPADAAVLVIYAERERRRASLIATPS